jgi:hypothetical protein
MSVSTADAVEQTVMHVLVSVLADGTMSCDPAELPVTGQDALIAFFLKGDNWIFPDTDAVVVNGPSVQFPIPSWTLNSKQAALLDRNNAAGSYPYTVTIEHGTTGYRQHLDPTIRNEA